ncbi:MAG TPA: UDP-N-acetylglucosamine 2-epimerase (non-hydrolyzing) [Candidatus Omnitrophota bacterium]|nr:UDP-N-acetylglucosamine 2-epimerase (non-hydrolyzing) [Candidatus Omnitrophota bacterium]
MDQNFKALFVFGTRPEALKMAPVIEEFRRHKKCRVWTCLTGQHREMVDQVLRIFGIKTDFDLNLMERGQTLENLTARVFSRMDRVLRRTSPDLLFVQGDTTTAFTVALKAFYSRIPVAHIEAGLRTFNKYQPFPEEINRVLISHLADYHFPPTKQAALNLRREGVPQDRIFVTGNTVVDALQSIRNKLSRSLLPVLKRIHPSRRIVLVTAHRRESFGTPLRSIFKALRTIAARYPDVEIVYPVHLNPNVQKAAYHELTGIPRIHLLHPLSYLEFLTLMKYSHLILTDSGGVQEEAPSFHKPVLVMREVSERNEGVELGVAKLVGTSKEKIINEAAKLLSGNKAYREMIRKRNPYGDGKASQRIFQITRKILGRRK